MKRNGLKKVLSVVTACALLLPQMMITGFAAADPTENQVIQYLTEGWTDAGSKGGIVDFSTVDTSDTSHGNVKWFSYDPDARMVATTVWSNEVSSVDKLVSFDLYIYDNTIPYEIRFCDGETKVVNNLGEIDINFTSTAEDKGMSVVNEDAKISINSTSNEVLSLENKKWHKVDVIFSKGKCEYYINGKNIGSKDRESNNSYFTGYQIVARKGNQAATVTDKSGIYIDNFKSVVYGDDAQFYGKASVAGSNINVEFSETISSTYTAGFSGVTVKNTNPGDPVEIGTPSLSGTTLTIPVKGTLADATEYMIDFLTKPVGISGKKLYANVYFYVDAARRDEKNYEVDFDDYTGTLKRPNDDTNVIAADDSWFTSDMINIKEVSEDTTHGKVLYAKSNTTTNLRWGVKAGDKKIDTTKGEVSVEFDIKIPDLEYKQFVVQLYSDVDGEADSVLVKPSNTTQYCTFTITGDNGTANSATNENGGKPYILFNPADITYSSNKKPDEGSGLTMVSLVKNQWHKVKLTVDNTKTDKEYPVIGLYVDNEFKATNTANISGNEITNILKGVRFLFTSNATDTATDKLWIDNVKFTYFEDAEATVKKVRMFDLEGNDYGPFATDVPASSERAEITLTSPITNTDGVTVSLSDGVTTINSDVTLSADGTKLTAIFKDMLKNTTDYTLTVSGVGEDDSSVTFTTSQSNELVIYNLRITDESGVTLPGKPTTAGTYYVKAKVINATDSEQTALILGAVYNGLRMDDVNFKEVTVGARSKSNEILLAIEVTSVEELALSAMAWEDFDTCKPILEAVEY